MAGLSIEIKIKDKESYMLGGVQKIEFERHATNENKHFDYISVTISDTRKYAYEDVEYINAYGGAIQKDDYEFQYILKFTKEEDFYFETTRKQLRSHWTTYCLHNDYECDTIGYDTALNIVWTNLLQNESYTESEWVDNWNMGLVGFDLFDDYMCREVS